MAGAAISSAYDPMLAKLAAWGPDRECAVSRLTAALRTTAVLGVITNVGFLSALLDHHQVRAGSLDTGLIERETDYLLATAPSPDDAIKVAVLLELLELEEHSDDADLWSQPTGWRIGAWAPAEWQLTVDGNPEPAHIMVTGSTGAARVALSGGTESNASVGRSGADVVACIDGVTSRWVVASAGQVMWLMRDGHVTAIEHTAASASADVAVTSDGQVRSPMPGTVVAISVSVGDAVAENASLAVVEAMKMEHQIRAPHAGVVERIVVNLGDQIPIDALLLVVSEA
jgi:acetyl-CoA/propionyl-CoA carboxylase biotin carboxyl carrier protein